MTLVINRNAFLREIGLLSWPPPQTISPNDGPRTRQRLANTLQGNDHSGANGAASWR